MNRIRNLIWGRGRPSRRGERDAQNPSRTELPLTNVMSKLLKDRVALTNAMHKPIKHRVALEVQTTSVPVKRSRYLLQPRQSLV
jgi:hypothetical protein